MRRVFLKVFLVLCGFTAFLSAKGQAVAEVNSGSDHKTITTITIIVMALTLLAFIVASAKKSTEKKERNKMMEEEQSDENEQAAQTDEAEIAAVAAALYLYFDNQHEVEQTGFWLNRPLNQQTTWTAKDNLFRKLPVRKF